MKQFILIWLLIGLIGTGYNDYFTAGRNITVGDLPALAVLSLSGPFAWPVFNSNVILVKAK